MASLTEITEKVIDSIAGEGAMGIPQDVEAKLKRGKSRLDAIKWRRMEAIEFVNGNHYVRANGKTWQGLSRVSTVPVSEGGKMPDHRVRRSHDLLSPIVNGKISAATQRIPGYEIEPNNQDPESWNAAKLGEKVAFAGYDRWRVKQAFQKLVWFALVTEEGFIMPCWDGSIGPFIDVSRHPEADAPPQYTEGTIDEETGEEVPGEQIPNPYADSPDPENPEYVGLGEVKLWVGGGLEVTWEPGVEFEDSKWWAIMHARPKDMVESEPGFIGGKLTADAETSSEAAYTGTDRGDAGNLVLVKEFLERPCPQYPQGRRMFFANKRQIFATEDYPLKDHEGNVLDEPCIHRLSYSMDAASDRERGLIRQLIESMRTYDFAWNKIAEYAQVGLVPQMMAPEGAIRKPRTDEPGAIVEYDPSNPGGFKPEWAENLGVPNELFTIQANARTEMGMIAYENEVPSQIGSQQAVAQLLERDQIAWNAFLENEATVYSKVARDCLTLVQLYYDDDRMMKYRGRSGWLPLENFRGADLRGQTDVRVSAGSLEPRTRAGVEKRILMISERFPGYFPPEVLLSALENGNAEGLLQAYEEDVARANFLISQIRSGTFWDLPMRPAAPGEAGPKLDDETGEPEWIKEPGLPQLDPETGEPVPGSEFPGEPVMETEVPGWMPRSFDNVPVHKSVFEVWMKGDEWNYSSDEVKEATYAYYGALLDIETKNAQRERELQTEMAESQGLQNAAKPQVGKPMPSLPSAPGAE